MKSKISQLVKFRLLYNKSFAKCEMPLKLAFKFHQLNLAMESHINFYNSEFQKILGKYQDTEATAEEGYVRIKEDSVKQCNKEMLDLENLEVELDIDKYKFTLDELEKGPNIAPEDMTILFDFIQE